MPWSSIPAALKSYLAARPAQKRAIKRLARIIHAVSPWRFQFIESALVWALRRRIAWKMWQDWKLAEHAPHFFPHRYGCFGMAFDRAGVGFAGYTRAFLALDVVRPGETVLDIGCGDGFFASRFLAAKASHVDAVDIEPDAIEHAVRFNSSANVAFFLADAVADAFPGTRYDVIVWDGAIGHFDGSTTSRMLEKIRAALAPDGVFCGSEELGRIANEDHLQCWQSLDEVRAMLEPYFAHVQVRETEYVHDREGHRRREFYWRCSNSADRLLLWE